MRKALEDQGIDVPALPGTQTSTLAGLANLCGQAGFADITTTIIEVTVTFANFHKFWESQTIGYRPTTRSSMLWNPKERESVVLPL